MKLRRLLLLPLLVLSFNIASCAEVDQQYRVRGEWSGKSTKVPSIKSTTAYNDSRVVPDGMLYLYLKDPNGYILNKNQIASKYVPGARISFEVLYSGNTKFLMYVNGDLYKASGVLVEHADGKTYWEFSFQMPTKDTTVEFRKTASQVRSDLMRVDYGNYAREQATLLFGTMVLPFSPEDYNIERFVAGDYVTIVYDGEWTEYTTYPSTLARDKITIQDVGVVHGDVYLFQIQSNGEYGKRVAQIDGYRTLDTKQMEYCINKDKSFATLSSLPINTIMYGVTQHDSFEVLGFYRYNPFE